MDLFLDKYVPSFEKTAAEVELPEDPNQWPHELLQELHKQVSFISDFDPRIVMDRVDAEKGYGFGHFEVGTRMSDPNASPETKSVTGARQARIPIIISEGRLKPFDLIINESSKIFPLTETRVRQALFRPNMFDLDAKSPGDTSIIDRLYPPMRQSEMGGRGGMVAQSSAGMGKEGAAHDHVDQAFGKKAGLGAMGSTLAKAQARSQVARTGQAAARYTGRTTYSRPVPIKQPGFFDKLLGRTKTAEEQFNDFVTEGETKQPGFTAWDGQKIETAGASEQRQRVRAEGDLQKAIDLGEGAWGQVLSDQNRQAMGMPARGPIKGTNGPENYNKRQAELHGIAGQVKTAAATKIKIPRGDKIIEGQKAQGYKPWYAGSVAPDGSIKKAEVDPVSFSTAMRNIRQMPANTRSALLSVLLEKKASTGSLLSTILPTINEGDFLRFAEACQPEEVKIAALRNTPVAEAFGKLAAWEPHPFGDVGRMVKQDVTQVSKMDDGTYRVKYASSRYWDPRTVIMDRGSVYDAIGGMTTQVDLHGSITMSKGAMVEGEGPEADKAEPIEDFGMYRVETAEGASVIGFAIPNLIDLDGTVLPLVLFTNGSASAVQGDMVGVRSGGEPNLPEGPEQGHGVFVRVRDNGKAEATTPIEIKAAVSDEKGQSWIAEDFQGRPVTIRKQPNIQMPVKVDDEVLLPESFKWMPLGGESLAVVGGVEAFGKQAEAIRHLLSVEIRGGSGAFSIDGPPVDKLASAQRHFLDYDGAAFLLGGLGVGAEYAMKKLSEARFAGAPVRVRVGRVIKTAEMREAEAMKTAGARGSNHLPFYHREHLVKEAAVIADPTAVDTVLSLGFINPENIMGFINALPNIENAQSRMCEMLLGARLGLKEIPEGALEKAIQSTEDVLEGLKVLSFQET